MTFVLSIETPEGAFQHPFHLGTDEAEAKVLAMETFHGRNKLVDRVERDHRGHLMATVTVALMSTTDKKYFNVYDGETWSYDQ